MSIIYMYIYNINKKTNINTIILCLVLTLKIERKILIFKNITSHNLYILYPQFTVYTK